MSFSWLESKLIAVITSFIQFSIKFPQRRFFLGIAYAINTRRILFTLADSPRIVINDSKNVLKTVVLRTLLIAVFIRCSLYYLGCCNINKLHKCVRDVSNCFMDGWILDYCSELSSAKWETPVHAYFDYSLKYSPPHNFNTTIDRTLNIEKLNIDYSFNLYKPILNLPIFRTINICVYIINEFEAHDLPSSSRKEFSWIKDKKSLRKV